MITLGILSWGDNKTLINTLDRLTKVDLWPYIESAYIFFQEMTENDRAIAKHFGLRYMGTSRNIGISEGYSILVNSATEDKFLFLESDWAAIRPASFVIPSAENLLDEHGVDLVKLRHRQTPGNPLWTLQFKDNEYQRPTHLLDCVHWHDTPDVFPEINKFRDWYLTTSKNGNWTLNPTLARTEFLRKTILPRIAQSGEIRARGTERDLQPWWETQNFIVAQGEGIFTHHRIG